METKTISQQPTLLPSFGYFAEVGGGGTAAAWQYSGMVGGAGQPEVPVSPPPLDFDKDTLGQYIHKIYCRDCCRVAEEQQQTRHGDSDMGRRVCTSSSSGGSGGGGVTLTATATILSSHNWDQHQPDDLQEQQDQQQSAAAAEASALLLPQSLFTVDAATAAFFSGLDKEKNKESLKRKLLLRRSAGELPADQGKRSPLKSPPPFTQQKKHLQRAQIAESHARAKSQGQCAPEWSCDMDSDPHPDVLCTDAKPQKRPRVAVGGDSNGKGQQQLRRSTTPGIAAVTASSASPRDRLLGKATSRFDSSYSRTGHGAAACNTELKSINELLDADGQTKGGGSGGDVGRTCFKNGECSSSSSRSGIPSMGGHSGSSGSGRGSGRHKEAQHSSLVDDTIDDDCYDEELLRSGSPLAGGSPTGAMARCGDACGAGECGHRSGQLKAAGTTTSAMASTAYGAAASTAAGLTNTAAGGAVAPTQSPTKAGASSSTSSSKPLQTNRTGGSNTGGSGSKKNKPKAHTKTKVIKFHEYKGPPPQPAASATTSTSKVTSGQGGSSRDCLRAGTSAVTAAPMAAASPLPVSASEGGLAAVSSGQAGTTNHVTGMAAAPAMTMDLGCGGGSGSGSSGSISTELAQYNLMLRQQQLFLQWQLELQQKSMPLLVPMVQTPSPPPQLPAMHQRSAAAAATLPVCSTPVHVSMAVAAAGQLQPEAPLQQPLLVGSLGNLQAEAALARPGAALVSGGSSCSGGSGSSPLPALSPQMQQIREPSPTTTAAAEFQTMHDSHGLPCTALCTPMPRALRQQPSPQMLQTSCKEGPSRMSPSLEDMKIVELKAELKQRGLPVSGSKQQLIKRLQSHQSDSRSVSGDAIAHTTTPSVAGGSASSPLSVPSSSLASPPSTPMTLSSQSEDGYLQMLSASASSSISSLAAADDEERMFHGGGAAIFLPSQAAVHEEIVRQQQRQIEELQKLLRESQLQLSTQQLHASTAATGASMRKDRKSPKKSPGRGAAAAAAGSAVQLRTAEHQQLQHLQVADNMGCSEMASAAPATSSSLPTRMPLLPAAAAANPQPVPAPVMEQQQPQPQSLRLAAFANGQMQAVTTVVPRHGSTPIESADGTLPHLSLPVGITALCSPIEALDKAATDGSMTKATAAAAAATGRTMAPSCGSPSEDNTSSKSEVNIRARAEAAPSTTTMDDVLEMLIAASPDLMAGITDGKEEDATADRQPMTLSGSDANTSVADTSSVHTYLMVPLRTSTLSPKEDRLHPDQRGDASSLAEQNCVDITDAATVTHHCLSPGSADWSELVEGAGLNLDNADDNDDRSATTCQFGSSTSCHEARQAAAAAAAAHMHEAEEDVAGLALDDLESNLGTLEFKDEGSSSSGSSGGCGGSTALDWLDVMMQSNISVATPGVALLPLSFQGDPLLTSHPANVADLFTMDDADFSMLSDFGCSISWEKLQEVTTA